MRILKQNFEQLGSVIGGTLINVFKPIVSALNVVIGKFIQFAKVVSDSLGKIFGWQYQDTGVGGVATELEDASDASEGVGSGLGKAADNAKKLKQQLQGFDELNVLTSDSGSGGSGGSGGGGGGGASGGDSSGGQWVKTESIFKDYESSLDSLYKLGDYIGTTLTNTLNNIDWDSVYEGARDFGSGLASFLNGLISPDLFKALGKTVAGAINTVFSGANGFAEEFEWEELGESLVSSLTGFFKNWDAGLTAKTFSNFIKGFLKTLKGAFEAISDQQTFKEIGQKLVDFICGIDWAGLLWNLADLGVALYKAVIDGLDDFFKGSAEAIAERLKPVWRDLEQWWKDNVKLKKIEAPSVGDIKEKVQTAWSKAREWWKSKTALSTISVKITSIKDKLKDAWTKARNWWNKNKPSLSQITAKIKIPRLVITWDTSGAAAKVLQKLGLKGFPNFSVRYYAEGGFPEDGWFRANHGELMGKFDNGKSVVANNRHITQGIADAVYQGNRENNALMRQELELMRRQNELLMDILEKETGISSDDIFRSVRKSADNYRRVTGRPAFSW